MTLKPSPRTRTILLPRRAAVSFLVFVVVAFLSLPALADHIGPHRTVPSFDWERLACHYEAVHDPPGTGYFGCTLELFEPPDGSCPSEGSVAGFFNPGACSGWPGGCTTLPCDISLDDSIQGCSEGEEGCRAVEKTSELPPATVNGSISCSVSGSGGWCRGGAELSLSGSEPLSGYSILSLEGTRNGEAFGCEGSACGVPLLEGNNSFTFWARSSYGDTSSAGSADGNLDSAPPTISGDATGSAGDADWFVSEVTVSASASNAAPGSGLASLEVSVDGGGWAAYSGPIVLSDGEHIVDLRASDGAGNGAQESLEVRVDTQPPAADLSAGSSFCPGCGQTLGIDLSVQDAGRGIVEWTLKAGGVLVASGSGPTSQNLGWDGSGLGGGSHDLTLAARDEAGNSAEASDTFDLIVPTAEPEPPPEEAAAESTSPPTSATPIGTASTGTAAATASIQPTRTPLTIPFGALPAAPLPSGGQEPLPNVSSGSSGESSSTASESTSGPVFGAAALALIATATAFTLDRLRRRQQEEAALRLEMERRNAAAEAKDEVDRAALAAAIAAASVAASELDRLSAEEAQAKWMDQLLADSRPDATDPAAVASSVSPEGDGEKALLTVAPDGETEQRSRATASSVVADALRNLFPSFRFTPHYTEEPLINTGLIEAGAYEHWGARTELNPVVELAPERWVAAPFGVRIGVGWDAGRISISFNTPTTVHDLGEGGTTASVRGSGAAALTWNGWNTRLEARYSPLDFSVGNEGTVGYSGSGSQGVYVREMPVQGLVLLGGIALVGWGLATMNPQVPQWIERLKQILTPGGLAPVY